tara:strand:- start:568 stop:867 length:300 start_codon:yes stop_codon:yes gene_type:complete
MKKKELDKYLNEAINNIHEDRQVTKDLLKDVMRFLAVEETAHSKVGPVAAKYVETLQRSNEQLVKIVALLQKRETGSEKLSTEDKQELFDIIQGDGTDG